MKVLVPTADSPIEGILSSSWACLRPVAHPEAEPVFKGVVAEFDNSKIRDFLNRISLSPDYDLGEFWSPTETMKDLQRFSKHIASADLGETVTVKAVKSGLQIQLPKREAPELAVGDAVAFNDRCKPKYMLNVRGVVTDAQGVKVVVQLDEGDLDRLRRAGHDRFDAVTTAPVGILDKVGA